MSGQPAKAILLVGFADDLSVIKNQLCAMPLLFYSIEHNWVGNDEIPDSAAIVYVFSCDTAFSSQAMSMFAWFHDHAKDREEYLLMVNSEKAQIIPFDFLRKIPEISVPGLLARI